MAITSSSVNSTDTLETFRQEFNNAVVDLGNIDGANTFTSSIIFEGATADSNETTLTVTDPTADRTITLPNLTGTVSLITATETLTNKTLTAPKFADGGFIADANGNEVIKITTTASAVNELTVTGGASSSPVTLSATGDDTHINLVLTPKGTGTVNISASNLNYAGTAVTATGAELNIIDGDTSATSTTVADADRVVFNDNGTMVQVAVTDLAAYFDDEITAMPNLVSTGALDSGSITSGFGTINTGSSAITTTGLISGGSLDIDDVVINGTTIGHTDDTDLITVADGIVTVAGEISVTTLDIGGTNVASTAAELNLLDGSAKSTSSITLADADGIIVIDGTTTKQIPASDFKTYVGDPTALAIALG